MSRVGNAPINVPEGVTVEISDKNLVTVKGPKGEMERKCAPYLTISLEDGVLTVKRNTEQKLHKAQHGLCRALLNNMVVGVSEGYKIEQELIGVGYRANAKGQTLELALGHSHPIHFMIPEEVKVTAVSEKGQAPRVILESHDKQLIGQVAAKIRSFRKPEPYKGKGIRFVGEEIRRKAGKAAAKA